MGKRKAKRSQAALPAASYKTRLCRQYPQCSFEGSGDGIHVGPALIAHRLAKVLYEETQARKGKVQDVDGATTTR